MVKLNHSGLNLRFDIGVIFMTNYFFSKRRHHVNNDTLLMIYFMNLKIKSTQSFKCGHKDKICIHMFIEMSNHTYINIYICTIFF
jgi:hypothetical protein